jgi:hypothetical protein
MHKSLARKKNMNEEKHYGGWKKEVCKVIEVGGGIALRQWNL